MLWFYATCGRGKPQKLAFPMTALEQCEHDRILVPLRAQQGFRSDDLQPEGPSRFLAYRAPIRPLRHCVGCRIPIADAKWAALNRRYAYSVLPLLHQRTNLQCGVAQADRTRHRLLVVRIGGDANGHRDHSSSKAKRAPRDKAPAHQFASRPSASTRAKSPATRRLPMSSR